MIRYKSKEFRELKDKWYRKLKDDGFNDAEQDDTYFSDGRNHDWYANAYSTDEFFSRAEYFRRARHLIYDFEFENEAHKKIWELHSDGMTVREIAKYMRESGIKSKRKNSRTGKSRKWKWSKDTVSAVIREIRKQIKG